MDARIISFLDKGPPWLGDSGFADKDHIKTAGGRWDGASKKWRAPDEPSLIALIGGGKWRPTGCDSIFAGEVVRYIHRRDQLTERTQKTKQTACKTTTNQTETEHNSVVRNDLMILPDEPDLLAEALRHGVNQEMVRSTGMYTNLGPRSGISDVRRLFRGIQFGIVTWDKLKNGEAARIGCDHHNKKMKKAHTKSGVVGQVQHKSDGGGTNDIYVQRAAMGATTTMENSKRVEKPVTYNYKAKCDTCNTTLDSRLQFGLQCECFSSPTWYACGRCFTPIKAMGQCEPCVNVVIA